MLTVLPILPLLLLVARAPEPSIDGAYQFKAGTIEGSLEVKRTSPERVEFTLELVNITNAHFGILENQSATLQGRTAVYRGPGDSTCSMSMQFQADRVIVEQHATDAECGFGVGVSAHGTWMREGAFRFEDSRPGLSPQEFTALLSLSPGLSAADQRMNQAFVEFRKSLQGKTRKAFVEEQRAWMVERDIRAKAAGIKGSPPHLDTMIQLTLDRATLLENARP